MKIIKIFGAVLALHGLAFLLIFANPGCSSTKRRPLTADTAAAPEPAPTINVAAIPAAPITLAAAAPIPLGFDPEAPAISGMERYSPRRPAAESAAPATPAPEAAPTKSYTVAGGDSLWSIAKKNDLTVAELSRANNLTANALIHPGQKLVIPTKNAPAAASAATTAGAAAGNTYRVKANETLAGIAKRAGVPAATLRELNGLKSDALRFGQDLKLPPGVTVAAEAPAAKPGDNVYTHTVQPGETLEMIARKYGMKQAEIGAANNISNPALIRAGATLVIPGWQQPAAKAAAPEPAAKAPQVPVPATAAPIRIATPIEINK
jgi:LysM repeat protein